MQGNFAAVIILLIIALAFTGWLIYKSAEGEEVKELVSPSVPLTSDEPKEEEKILPDTTWLLDSLAIFRQQNAEPEVEEKIGSASVALLFSPLSYRFGISSSVSLFGVTLGAVYTDGFYISLGYTFSF